MTSTPSQALTKRQNEQSLMPPPPPPKRIKRPATVLDEDVYTNALSEIIARDYFPGLLEEQVKQEYLDALESKNKEWIASSKRKLTDLLKTPGRARSVPRLHGTERLDDTPTGWQGDTPRSVISTTTTPMPETAQKDIPDITNLGLMAFQAKYTSEDNESFNRLLDKQNAKRQEKYAWLWSENKIPTARQIAHRQREAKRIAAQGGSTERQLAIKTDLDARPAKPDTWKSRPENSLMFMPSSIEDAQETISQKAEDLSRAAPKRVVHENTRLPEPSVRHGSSAAEGNDIPPSPSISAIKDAIAGRPRLTESEAGYAAGETPRVNGYAFVDEDEPEPDYDHAAAETSESLSLSGDDLRLLGASDSAPNPFSIRENRKREDLHHRMVDRVARTKRAEKATREVRTPVTPRFASSPRLDFGLRTPAAAASSGQGKALTPAAQKLLQRVGSTPRPAASSSSSLRNMWTPTPRRAK
ncbi:hypothetical protein CNMCM5623_002899 [Aspergillus felis]|uniref:Nuclear protein Es2 n=1 Tax=Aspergillus felis TaxID=1287682 RepID=A0A8H6UXI1_9EURO|nr:hypothetical protein CNMCM5623_002899 [Aspergillus felis]KAF7183452.1 hypothetical protein CNMCM7691_003651 [Aspergillus felis]